MELNFIEAHTAEEMMESGKGVMIDVREPEEVVVERIKGSFEYPLSNFNPQVVLNNHEGKTLIFQCKMGKRAANACSELLQLDEGADACVLAGGIEGWKDLGHPVI
jgi:rhodanese-related sulfurtransferase